jgi:CBS-domain-containing membrane protein
MLNRMLRFRLMPHGPNVAGCLWTTVLLGSLAWLDLREGGIFLVPPFAATLTIMLYLPNAAVAQPATVIGGSVLSAAIGTMLSQLLGIGAVTAVTAVLTAMIALPLLRIYHPPGIALAMYPALLHPGAWFALQVVLPFTVAAVISFAALSHLIGSWPRYPAAN